MITKPRVLVAIDGPAGSGKTSVAKALSKKLGILYLNTGAMYRAVGLYALNNNIDPLSEQDVLTFLNNIKLDVVYKLGEQRVILNDEDVTEKLSSESVSDYASKISSLKPVREKMVKLQQTLAQKQSLIIDGRDIGTVVLPNATHKFYLDAKVEERAKRRFLQYQNKGVAISLSEVLKDMKERDLRDTTREISPLKMADDAKYIDSTSMTEDEVLKVILAHFKN